ncbi:uncharacterized protein LOC115015488 isoform X5 [Cottoperca gobio]|uniref:Uncharacterized protein LOC115015488 isoform X5 n=1 Tax=Cottoperca gobio TaxID=56716 RepID=A0A6J2QJX1_COTGO|nr:uncharacterized protein LOC115015488 isoform X5 [Cottoperca gobio]
MFYFLLHQEAERRVETVVRDAEPFRTNAFLIIDQMLELFDPGRDLHTLLVDEAAKRKSTEMVALDDPLSTKAPKLVDEEAERRNNELEATYFNWNASFIINKMLELNNPNPSTHTTLLVDEILHSIFFLGKLNDPTFSPQNIHA